MKHLKQLSLRELEDATVIAVKAVPGASRDRIAGILGDCLKITTASPAEKGKANQAVARTLAKALTVGPRDVTLRTGSTSARKEFCIRGLTAREVRARLEKLSA